MSVDAGNFGAAMRAHLEEAEERNAKALDDVAAQMLEVVRRDLRIHVAGTGHSTGLVLETFYRAGGLACVNPIVHPGLIPLLGGGASTVLERNSGLAAVLLARAAPEEGELAVVFSTSGANAVPVELAEGLREAGVTVIAVSSLPHLEAAPARVGRKLDTVADIVLDTGTPVGDVAYGQGGQRTAALSSLTSVYLWNLLLARLVDRAAAEGIELPLWTSANTPGGDERNAALFARYRHRVGLL
jgi:uncharacterized phosphosugar-binding protein